MRRRLLLLSGCALAAILLTFLWPRDRGPKYQGKSLSAWLDVYFADSHDKSAAQQAAAADAVRHIGTNALPWLIKWLRSEPPAWRTKLEAAWRKLPDGIGNSGPILQRLAGKEPIYGDRAVQTFALFGESASPMIPELSRLLRDPKPAVSTRAAEALGCIGDQAMPALIAALTDQRVSDRSVVAVQISFKQESGTNGVAAIAALTQCLKSKDPQLAFWAGHVLGRSWADRALTIPVLIDGLSDPRPDVRAVCAESLGWPGEQSRQAVPSLTKALSDPDPGVRNAASEALRRIGP